MHTCVYVHIEARGQCYRLFIGIHPHYFFRTKSLTSFEPGQKEMLVGQRAPEILLSLPFHFWDYKYVSLFLVFYMCAKD